MEKLLKFSMYFSFFSGFAVYEVPGSMTRLTPQYVMEHVSIEIDRYIIYIDR